MGAIATLRLTTIRGSHTATSALTQHLRRITSGGCNVWRMYTCQQGRFTGPVAAVLGGRSGMGAAISTRLAATGIATPCEWRVGHQMTPCMRPSDIAVGTMQTLARYALALDTTDVEALVQLLAEGVRLTRGSEESEGIDAFVEAYRPFFASRLLGSRHVITNMIVNETEPGCAIVRSRFEASMFTEIETRRVIGSYTDDLVLSDGVWLFQHKRNFVEWELKLPPVTPL